MFSVSRLFRNQCLQWVEHSAANVCSEWTFPWPMFAVSEPFRNQCLQWVDHSVTDIEKKEEKKGGGLDDNVCTSSRHFCTSQPRFGFRDPPWLSSLREVRWKAGQHVRLSCCWISRGYSTRLSRGGERNFTQLEQYTKPRLLKASANHKTRAQPV